MDKQRFSVLLRPSEQVVLRNLASEVDRSQGATIRLLIRQEAQRRGMWPVPGTVKPRPASEGTRP